MAGIVPAILGGGLLASLFGQEKPEEKEVSTLVQPDPDDPARRIKNRREQAKQSREGGRESTLLTGNFSKPNLG